MNYIKIKIGKMTLNERVDHEMGILGLSKREAAKRLGVSRDTFDKFLLKNKTIVSKFNKTKVLAALRDSSKSLPTRGRGLPKGQYKILTVEHCQDQYKYIAVLRG